MIKLRLPSVLVPAVVLVGLLSLGAKDEGCGTSLVNLPPETSGDASTDALAPGAPPELWEIPAVPIPGPPSPMSCAWLAGENCWKRVVRDIEACAPSPATQGSFSDDRRSCRYESGERTDFGGPINDPPSTFQIVDQRVVGRDGRTCYTGKIVGPGKVTISSASETVLFESLSLLTYRLTCADGTTWTSAGEGVCATFGLDYLAGRAPASLLSCNAETGRCTIVLSGGDRGRRTIARCGREAGRAEGGDDAPDASADAGL